MSIERLYPVWFVVCAAAGAMIGSLTEHGALRGLTAGMMAAALPLLLLMAAFLFLSLWRPVLPACRCGQCDHKGYRYVGAADEAQAGRRFSCPKCGRVYALSNGCFDELAGDGSKVPYMHHTRWGRWKSSGTGTSA